MTDDADPDHAGRVVVLGLFAAAITHHAERLPDWGEALPDGESHLMPGGKGSNQAVAASRAGAEVHIITRLGRDPWAVMAIELWRGAEVSAAVTHHDASTATASTMINPRTGAGASVVSPGVTGGMGAADVERRTALIAAADVLLTGLEVPMPAVRRALEVARDAGAVTILDPDPLPDPAALDDDLLSLCDLITPNRAEARALTGLPADTPEEALAAAAAIRARGARAVALTMGAAGAAYAGPDGAGHVPSPDPGAPEEMMGVGDAFAGVLAAGVAAGLAPIEAVRRACVAAAVSITRSGGARAMPDRRSIDRAAARSEGGEPDD